jgi:hypothetical protein
VVAFEPQNLVFQTLAANMLFNGYTNVQAINGAAYYKDGLVRMDAKVGNWGTAVGGSRGRSRDQLTALAAAAATAGSSLQRRPVCPGALLRLPDGAASSEGCTWPHRPRGSAWALLLPPARPPKPPAPCHCCCSCLTALTAARTWRS